MIAYIEGQVVLWADPIIVKTAAGVGYEIHVVDRAYEGSSLETFSAFIYTHIKDEVISYYAFYSHEARELFTHLISVSGVGPKIAMSMMRSCDGAQIKQAIWSQDAAFFSGIKGLGKKTVAKILLMLQDKFTQVGIQAQDMSIKAQPVNADVKMALVKLGYTPHKVDQAMNRIQPDSTLSTSEMIKAALVELSE